MLIKESGNKMEQVTSSICVVVASLGKCTNEEIISPGGPSKRTSQSSRKWAQEAVGVSATNSIQDTIEIGKLNASGVSELKKSSIKELEEYAFKNNSNKKISINNSLYNELRSIFGMDFEILVQNQDTSRIEMM